MNRFLNQRLSSSVQHDLSRSVHLGYLAIDQIFKQYPLLGNFAPGSDVRPHLINIAVQHELSKLAVDGVPHKIEKNAANNCNHLVLYPGGLKLTTHFLGSHRPRKMARKAVCRKPYAALNADVFTEFGDAEGSENESGRDFYCQLYHFGLNKPERVWLVTPDDAQRGIIGESLMLPNVEIQELEKTENIKETIEHTLKFGVANDVDKRFKESG